MCDGWRSTVGGHFWQRTEYSLIRYIKEPKDESDGRSFWTNERRASTTAIKLLSPALISTSHAGLSI